MKKLTCHCGEVEIQINLKDNIDKLMRCNCSMCKRKGTMVTTINKEDLKIVTTERYVRYGHLDEPKELKFYITKPRNGEPATYGNGTMVAFLAETREAVNKFHEIALQNGAIDEGLPGVREDGNYYAYVRDLDGNKITAKCISN